MKVITLFKILIVTFLFYIINGCGNHSSNDNSSKPKTDLEKENLKGDVIAVFPDENTDGSIIEFDENGNFKRTILRFVGLSESIFNYKKNKLDNVLTTQYDEKEILSYYTKYSYSSDGNLISSKEVSPNWETNTSYIYENDKLIKEFKENNSKVDNSIIKDETNYFYDSKNQLDSSVEVSKMDDYKHTITYLFDKDGKTIKQVTDIPTDDILMEYLSYYNRNGDLEKIISKNLKTNKVETQEILYVYDNKSNWIEKRIRENNSIDKVNTRKIFYKGQDYLNEIEKFDLKIVSFKNRSVNNSYSENSNNNSNTKSSQSNNNQTNTRTNTYQQPVQREKQWVNCRDCNGQGIRICTYCSGRGSMKCDYCFGKGWKWYGTEKQTCNTCGGTGEKKCSSCYGKGNRGTCSTCGGRGQVQL